MPVTDHHSSELLARAQKGSSEALSALYDRYHTGVFHYLYYRVGDVHLAEDLASEVFLRMVHRLSDFQPRATSLQSWLFQVARNLVIDHYRRSSTRVDVELREDVAAHDGDPTFAAERRLTHEHLVQALNGLMPDQRDVVILRFIVGMTLAQTGNILHKSDDAVKGLQRRALQELRERMREWKVEDEKLG